MHFYYVFRLCKCFIDVFEFEILNDSTKNNWFISWLAKDLNQFQKLCQFLKEHPKFRVFLNQKRDEIIEYGRLKGFHSILSYNDRIWDSCFKNYLNHNIGRTFQFTYILPNWWCDLLSKNIESDFLFENLVISKCLCIFEWIY